MASLRENFSYQFIAALSSLLFPLISFPYLAHTLGPEMLGKVNYVDYAAGLVLTLTCLGIPLYGTRGVARNAADPASGKALLSELTGLWFWTGLAGSLLFAVFLLAQPRLQGDYGLIILGIVYILSNLLSADWYFQGKESFRYLSLRSVFLRAAGLVALFVLVTRPADYAVYYAIIVFTQVLTLALNYRIALPRILAFRPLQVWRRHRQQLLYFFIVSSFITLYDFTDTLLLGWLAGDSPVGYYTAAMKLIRLSLLLIVAANTILFPRLSTLAADKDKGRALDLLNRSVMLILALALPAMVLYFCLAPDLIHVFAGKAFAPSVDVMRWLSPLPVLIALSNLLMLYYLADFKKGLYLGIATILALGLNGVLNLLLIPRWGEQGSALASLSTELFILLVFARGLRLRLPLRELVTTILASALLIPLMLWSRTWFAEPVTGLVVSLLMAGAVYGGLQTFVFRQRQFREAWEWVIPRDRRP